jgi:hypothetical protein
MQWQDWVIGFSYLFFDLALIPSIRSKSKPALTTSLVTGVLNVLMSFTQITLGLWLGALGTFVNGSLWFILAYQKINEKKKSK